MSKIICLSTVQRKAIIQKRLQEELEGVIQVIYAATDK